MDQINNSISNNNKDDYEFFNFKKYLNVVIRNKKLISFSSVIFFVAACFYSLSIKRTWQGNFQIVVENQIKKHQKIIIFLPF